MELMGILVLVTCSIAGLLAIFCTPIGTLIIFIGAVTYAVITDFLFMDGRFLLILFVLYLCGETCEYFFVMLGAKKFEATKLGVIGALIGGIVGAALGLMVFGFGLILGSFLGIFLGAFVVEMIIQRDLIKSIKAGIGGVLGRVGSIIAKLIIALIMIGMIGYNIWYYSG